MSKHYVYHLIDPRTDKVFYIGKGVGKRIAAHEREAANGVYHPKCVIIREIWEAGLTVTRKIVKEFDTAKEALVYEKKQIARFGLDKLANIHPGNDSEGYHISPELQADRDIIYTTLKFTANIQKFGIDNLIVRIFGLEMKIPQKLFENVFNHYNDLIKKRGQNWVNDQIEKMTRNGKLVTR